MVNQRIFFIAVFIIALVISFVLDLPASYLHLILSVSVLAFELYQYRKQQLELRSANIFRLRSRAWLRLVPSLIIVFYFILKEPISLWSILTLSLISVAALSYAHRNRTLVYAYGEFGIKNLNTGKIIPAYSISHINLSQELIAIDTAAYKNELIINARLLAYPSWEALSGALGSLRERWARQEVNS